MLLLSPNRMRKESNDLANRELKNAWPIRSFKVGSDCGMQIRAKSSRFSFNC